MLTKTNKTSLKFQFSKFQNPKRSFVRTVEKIKFDKICLWFLEIVFLEVVFSKKIAMAPKDPKMILNATRPKVPPSMLNYCPGVPNSTAFCYIVVNFPDNWAFMFRHRLQWWIRNFRRKIVKNRWLKISKIPKVVLWGPLGGKFWKSLKTFGYICRRSSVFLIHSHWVSCKQKRKNNCWNFNF